MIWRMVAQADGLGRTLIPPELRANQKQCRACCGKFEIPRIRGEEILHNVEYTR